MEHEVKRTESHEHTLTLSDEEFAGLFVLVEHASREELNFTSRDFQTPLSPLGVRVSKKILDDLKAEHTAAVNRVYR